MEPPLANNNPLIYNSIKEIGPVYFWHSSKSISSILVKEKGKKHSLKYLD